jgi:hypothetical protein
METTQHKNVEKVIRYYLNFLPPRGVDSILDIGSGVTTPYKGVLKNRCYHYRNLDQRKSENINYVFDVTKKTPFKDKEFEWGWCSEVVEHIPKKLQKKFVKEICRICKNVVFTYPSPEHPSFSADPGHVEVKVNFKKFSRDFDIYVRKTLTGRNIVILSEDELLFTKKGIKYKNKKIIGPLDRWL